MQSSQLHIFKVKQVRRYILVVLVAAGASQLALADEVWPAVPATGGTGYHVPRFSYTTKAYSHAAFSLVVQEVNQVAKDMKLESDLPLGPSNVVRCFISPYGFAQARGAIGTVTTRKFTYSISHGRKFSYIEGNNQFGDCRKYQSLYTWPTNRIDLDEAYRQATNWLALASMDVKSLNRDCKCSVSIETNYIASPRGMFVPVYWVDWTKPNQSFGDVASVRLFTPTNALLHLRVEDPTYVLRPPLAFTNLPALLSQP
jgi:hypothetical protein